MGYRLSSNASVSDFVFYPYVYSTSIFTPTDSNASDSNTEINELETTNSSYR